MDDKSLFFFIISTSTIILGQVLEDDVNLAPQVASNDFHPTGQAIEVRIAVDDIMHLYADGKLIGTNGQWNLAKVYNIPLGTKVVGIQAKNVGGPFGIIAHFDGGQLFTDGRRWRCKGTLESDWLKESFDDSDWNLAAEISYKGGKINRIGYLLDMAKWIWSNNADDDTVYCRALFDITAYVRADDRFAIYADGNWIGTNSNYRDIRSFDIPGNTRLIAIRAKNRGGPYGIRASFGGRRLVTSSLGRWRCNVYSPDWAKPTYSDKNWPVARVSPGPQLSTCGMIDSTAKWIWGKGRVVTYCRAYLSMFGNLMVDDFMDVYADGVLVKSNRLWHKAERFKIPGATQVVAIKGRNTGGPCAMRGFFGGGRLVTGAHWKCSPTPAPNWNTLAFDDSTWPAATIVFYKVHPKHFTGVDTSAHGSQWIWAAGQSKEAYCRGYIRKAPGLATAVTDMDTATTSPVTSNTPKDDEENLVDQNTLGSNINHGNDDVDDVAAAYTRQVLKKQEPKKGQFTFRSKQPAKKKD